MNRSSFLIVAVLALIPGRSAMAQSYTTYFTGDIADVQTQPTGGVCLMGGASEHDEAMKWFLQQADGGDILVIRASGSDGYNNYLYSQLGVAVNSVETIVWHNAAASSDPYVVQQVQNAEGIWIAGGDQWNYVDYWKNTAIDSAINGRILNNNIVIGGTSAGMAVLGQAYYSAMNGSATSAQALADPYHSNVTVGFNDFFHVPYLESVITDTHYDNPDRRGRHVVFLARLMTDEGITPFGIACDEYTAVCIDANGLARVYGDWPNYDDLAYFVQPNCWLPNEPEQCQQGLPLIWDRNMMAIKTYVINGEPTGSRTFDMVNKDNGVGGTWQDWYIINGVLTIIDNTSPIDCSTSIVGPGQDELGILLDANGIAVTGIRSQATVEIYDSLGRILRSTKVNTSAYNSSTNGIEGQYVIVVVRTKTGVRSQVLSIP